MIQLILAAFLFPLQPVNAASPIADSFTSKTFREGMELYGKKTNNFQKRGGGALKDLITLQTSAKVAAEAKEVCNAIPADRAEKRGECIQITELFAKYPFAETISAALFGEMTGVTGFMMLGMGMLKPGSEESNRIAKAITDAYSVRDRIFRHLTVLTLWTDQSHAADNFPGGQSAFIEKYKAEIKPDR